VVAKLGSRIDHWYCAGLPGPRGMTGEALAERVRAALPAAPADGEAPGVQACQDPAAAYAAARERASENDRILVFGSFLTVSAVMQALGRST
jgi:dihydrofolate synthase/folylpolyglutamate synthase